MMFRRILLLFLCLLVCLPAFGLWKTLKTEAFTVYYPNGREQEAGEILEVLEYYRSYAGQLVGAPERRVAVVLEDIGTESNGLTDVVFHRILLFRSSPSRGELGYHQNWWRLVGVHEYTHWRHLSAAEGLPGFLTAVFGNTMAPGNYTPGWLKEGICVVAESGTSPYEGRLNEGLFDAYATILAQQGKLPSIVQATYNMDIFPGGTGPYLFGGQFVEFLVGKFGRQQVARFFMHYSASILSYLSPALPAAGLDRSARKVFGESIRNLWQEWQLELMRSSVSFSRPEAALTDHGWWLQSPVAGNGGLYYQRSFPMKPAPFSKIWQHQLLYLDPGSGTRQVLFRSSAPFTGPMRVRSDRLYYALKELKSGYDNHTYDRVGFTAVLYSRDLAGGRRAHRLFAEPFRTFEVLGDGTILTAVDREDAFGSVIRLHDPAAGDGEQDGTSEPFLVTDLLVSDIVADERNVFVAARADWDNTRIYRVRIPGWKGTAGSLSRLNPEEVRLEALHDTPFQEAELCLAEGRLFYSATYRARRTIYEYDVDAGMVYRGVASDFARSPAWDGASGTVYYIGLNPEGEDLYREKALGRPVTVPGPESERGAEAGGMSPAGVSSAGVPTAAELEIPEARIRRGGYFDNLVSLLPRVVVPVFSLDPSLDLSVVYYQAGAGIAGTSALGDISYILLGYYDSYCARPEVEASLQTNILAPLIATFDFAAAGVPSAFEPDDFVELGLTLEFPLYQGLGKGLSYFSVGTIGTLYWEFGGYKDRILYPYTVLGFQGAASGAFFKVGVEAIHDVTDDEFAYLSLSTVATSLVFLGTELSLQATFLDDLLDRNIWDIGLAPPGYAEALQGNWGVIIYSTLSVPVLRLRGGLWNPGLYIGDLFLEPFFSLASNQDQDLQMSYGGTIHLEIKAGARNEGFPLDLYAGLGVTLEGELFPILGIEIHGYGSGYARGRPGEADPLPVLRQ